MKDPLSIHLDHENAPVVLRSLGDDEREPAVTQCHYRHLADHTYSFSTAEPATLSGSVVLDLHERTDLKDIRLELTGR